VCSSDLDSTLYEFYKTIIKIRKNEPALNSGRFRFIYSDNPSDQLIYLREFEDDQIIVIINNASNQTEIVYPIKKSSWVNLVNGKMYSTKSRYLHIPIAAKTALLLKREILKNSLVNSDAFTLVERERILEILREINFGKTKYVDSQTAPADGQLYCVRYLIEGSLGFNEDKTLKGNLDATENYRDVSDYDPATFNIFGKQKLSRSQRAAALQELRKRRLQRQAQRKFSVACYLSAYEVRTGRVKVSVMGLGTNGLEAINDAVEELIDELASKDDGLRVATASGNTVYIDIGSKGGVKVGETFQVIHLGKEIRNRNGLIIGYEETEVGEIEVTHVKELMSIAKILSKVGEIKRGDLVKPAKP